MAPPLTIPPTAPPHTHTIILLHGRDSQAQAFKDELFETQDHNNHYFTDLFPGLKWVFPQARVLDSRFGDIVQWFDMRATEAPLEGEEEQGEELTRSVGEVLRLVEGEGRAVVGGVERVFLGGISQGCGTAVHILTALNRRMAGFVGLSGWLPLRGFVREGISTQDGGGTVDVPCSTAVKTPVFIGHCADDEVIDVKYGRDLRDALTEMCFSVEWHEYEDGGHWVNEPQGMQDICDFLRREMNTGSARADPT